MVAKRGTGRGEPGGVMGEGTPTEEERGERGGGDRRRILGLVELLGEEGKAGKEEWGGGGGVGEAHSALMKESKVVWYWL